MVVAWQEYFLSAYFKMFEAVGEFAKTKQHAPKARDGQSPVVARSRFQSRAQTRFRRGMRGERDAALHPQPVESSRLDDAIETRT